MSAQELRDELMTLLVAGHETTASELAWAFERLARSPAVLAGSAVSPSENGAEPSRRRSITLSPGRRASTVLRER